MKYFIIALTVLFIALPARAATTPITDEFVASYYKNCMDQRDQRMAAEAQDSLCTCTGQKMKESMTIDDIRLMGQQDQAARNMLNKMMLDVYVPCMGAPVKDMINTQCMSENKIDAMNIKKDALCGCMSDKTSAWFTTNGRDLMVKALAENPNIIDPMTPVMESPEFRQVSYENMLSCLPAK
ncbi:MAG TPA: hypothetical protein VIG74_05970 [Alphaproteobacteria bacterium]|jgi:hypothetical protein